MRPAVTFKDSSILVREIDARIWRAIAEAAVVWHGFGARLVVTSMNDGKHRVGSYHYQGRAVDLRTHNLPDGKEKDAAEMLQSCLGNEFRVLIESLGTPNEHCHVELRPEPA